MVPGFILWLLGVPLVVIILLYVFHVTYTLNATEYSETLLFSIRTDQIGGKDIVYDLAGKTQSVPVKMEGGRIEFKPPFDPPSFVFEGNKLTATLDGRVDVWEKVP
jgi:hypothetical protein